MEEVAPVKKMQPAFFLEHVRHNCLRAEKGSQDTYPPTAGKALQRYLDKGLTERTTRTGIVDQKINWPEPLVNPFEGCGHLFGLAKVCGYSKDLCSVPAKFFGETFEKIGRPRQ